MVHDIVKFQVEKNSKNLIFGPFRYKNIL